jgi:general secretion pathway protein D
MHNTPTPLLRSFLNPPAQRAHRPLFTFHFSLFTSAAAAALAAIVSLTLALSLPPAARAQAADPTLPSPALATALRTHLADHSDLTLRALVVGPDGEGAALIGTRDLAGAPVRAGTTLNQDLDGVTVPLTVESVTPSGVLLRTSPDSTLLLPSSIRPLPSQSPTPSPTPAPAASEFGGGRTGAHPPSADPPPTCHSSLVTCHSPQALLPHVEFTSVPLSSALRLLADQSGANISASAATADTPVSLFLRNVRPETAVEEICRVTGLWYRRDAATGIIRVTTMAEYEESLASFREEQTETYTLLYPNVLDVASVIYGLYPERVLLSLGEDQVLDGEQDDIARRFERFNLVADSGGSTFMRMDPGSLATRSSSSGSSGTISFNGGRVTVVPPLGRLTPADAARLTAADAEAPEAADAALTDLQTRTANIFVTVSAKNSMLMVRTSDARALEDIRALVRRLDVPTPMVLLEVKVLELALDDDFTSSFEYQFTQDYNTTDPKHLVNTAYGFPGFDPLSADPRTDSMSFRLLSSHLQMRIQLLEKEGKAKTLATPLLLTANNEVSRLFIGEERPMVRNITSQTIANGDTTITVPQTEFDLQSVGTMLLITPNINADRTVTLRLLQENSEISKGGATIPIYSATDGGIIQNVAIDVVSSRSITGTFIAQDNLVTAVGGLVKEVESEQVSRVPVLGRIPLLGWFFRSTEKIKQRTELVVLIRPHVILTPSEATPTTQSLLDRLSAHPARDGRPSLTPPPPTGAPSPSPSPWR